MDEKNVEIQKKLSEILSRLTKIQLRYLVVLQECPNKDEAAKALHISPSTIYNWPPEVEEAANLMAQDVVVAALELRKKNLIKAISVKTTGLDSKDEKIRQNVATEIIEWELGKAAQSLDLTSKGERLPAPQIIEITKSYEKANE